MSERRYRTLRKGSFIVLIIGLMNGLLVWGDPENLVSNPSFAQRSAEGKPAEYDLSGDAQYRYLGDRHKDMAGWGIAFPSGNDVDHDGRRAGAVSQVVHVDVKTGRWYRFSFRGLPQDNFTVNGDELSMEADFLGNDGITSYDGKSRKIYPLIRQARHDLAANGDNRVGGAAVWQTYQLDFYISFPQVKMVRLSARYAQGAGQGTNSSFFLNDFSLVRIDPPAELMETAPKTATTRPTTELKPMGTPIALGGRWFYDAKPGETQPPQLFNSANADRLLYRDAKWQAPFIGNMSSLLRVGEMGLDGHVVTADEVVADNVTIRFDADSLIMHTHGLPNHPTGKFPEEGFGRVNRSYIQEKDATYYIPLNPQVNANHKITTIDNSNHALPMGPIGVAVNGVVFFNPFDANSMDASDIMDRCCGHPAPDNTYHYHKYPICIYSPWADEGAEHSPLIGWAFDGFPIYGPYESANVMAKDLHGANALNGFNLHYDKDRGWHYHVTPGKFPYVIGGYWGKADARDVARGRPPGGMMGRQRGGGDAGPEDPPPDRGMGGGRPMGNDPPFPPP